MFKFSFIITSFILIVCSILTTLWITKITTNDQFEYEQIILNSETPQNINYKNKQQRNNVTKFICSSEKTDHLNCIFKADKSQLIHSYKDKKTTLTEKMQNLTGFIQQKKYFLTEDGKKTDLNNCKNCQPMQQIYYIETKEAIYSYNTNILNANTVNLIEYNIKGHKLNPNELTNEAPTMKGIANKASFTLNATNPTFDANNLKIVFDSKDLPLNKGIK